MSVYPDARFAQQTEAALREWAAYEAAQAQKRAALEAAAAQRRAAELMATEKAAAVEEEAAHQRALQEAMETQRRMAELRAAQEQAAREQAVAQYRAAQMRDAQERAAMEAMEAQRQVAAEEAAVDRRAAEFRAAQQQAAKEAAEAQERAAQEAAIAWQRSALLAEEQEKAARLEQAAQQRAEQRAAIQEAIATAQRMAQEAIVAEQIAAQLVADQRRAPAAVPAFTSSYPVPNHPDRPDPDQEEGPPNPALTAPRIIDDLPDGDVERERQEEFNKWKAGLKHRRRPDTYLSRRPDGTLPPSPYVIPGTVVPTLSQFEQMMEEARRTAVTPAGPRISKRETTAPPPPTQRPQRDPYLSTSTRAMPVHAVHAHSHGDDFGPGHLHNPYWPKPQMQPAAGASRKYKLVQAARPFHNATNEEEAPADSPAGSLVPVRNVASGTPRRAPRHGQHADRPNFLRTLFAAETRAPEEETTPEPLPTPEPEAGRPLFRRRRRWAVRS